MVARHLDLHPKTVKAIDKATLQAEFGQTIYGSLKRLAIDEMQGQRTLSIVKK